MIDPIIYQDQLKKMSGYERNHDIEIWLKNLGVPYTVGKNGIISTTITAFDGLTKKKRRTGTAVDF